LNQNYGPEIPLPILTEENYSFADLEAQVNPVESEGEGISLEVEEIDDHRVDLESSGHAIPRDEIVGTSTTEGKLPGGSELTDQDAAFAWLETLAGKARCDRGFTYESRGSVGGNAGLVKQDALAAQMASELSKVESTGEELVDEVIAADESDVLGDDLMSDDEAANTPI